MTENSEGAKSFIDILKRTSTTKYTMVIDGHKVILEFDLTSGQATINTDGVISMVPFTRE